MNNIFEYSLSSITRFGIKNIAIASIFSFLVFLFSSSTFITNSIKMQLNQVALVAPDIIVNKQVAGRYYFLDEKLIDEILQIPGILHVKSRIFGQYHLKYNNTYLSILALEPYELYGDENITILAENLPQNNSYMYASKNVLKTLLPYTTNDQIVHFLNYKGEFTNLHFQGYFNPQTSILSNDVVLISTESARKILGMQKHEFTDIAIKVANPNEVDFIAAKIEHLYPKLKTITKNQIQKDIQLFYQYKSGWFLLLLIISFATFAIILYDKASGITSEQKQEIGILKAIGWDINHIILSQFYEALIISLLAFFIGIFLSMFFVFILQAPLLRDIFSGYSQLKQQFDFVFYFDIKTFALLFFCTIPFYIGACIIPAWKNAIRDAGEIMR